MALKWSPLSTKAILLQDVEDKGEAWEEGEYEKNSLYPLRNISSLRGDAV
jgi:hypothetical protein